MPHIAVAMERSLQNRSLKDAFVQLVARSTFAALTKRATVDDIKGDISDVRLAFSSWDNCMQADFCKWPVIAVIAVVGLILVSIVWCIVRCCCCGLSCCCECFRCLRCCGNCCGCCDPPRSKGHMYLDEPYVPPHHDQAYRNEPPMHYPSTPAYSTPKDGAPQYATFDSGDKKDADALPAMPTWGDADSKQVLIEEEAVEMEPLKKPPPTQPSLARSASHATTNSPMSPAAMQSPYGPPSGPGADPYGTQAQGYDHYNGDYGYGNQGYGIGGAMASGAMGQATPHQDYDNGYGAAGMGQGYPQSQTPGPYNGEYGNNGAAGAYGNGYQVPPVNDGYGDVRRGSPGPQTGYGYGEPARVASPAAFGNPSRMASPGPQAGYGYPQRAMTGTPSGYPQRAMTGTPSGYPQRTQTQTPMGYPSRAQTTTPGYAGHHPAPSRQYSADSARPLVQPSPQRQFSRPTPTASPVQMGFDFNTDNNPSSPTKTAHNGGPAYPGYRSYKPADAQQDGYGY
ncbi:hypothetical protein F4780DRAFT_185096 [Xylariomycetidae sp. FL0641]|nr:hypothetical protein F4780DRAFT_185096 [Xylariomycetidae sp. FL0641]